MGGMGSYLGIPESLSGPKTQVFSFLQDRLHGRVNGWTTKLLSRGGKEVMIKAVATALPNHVMSCYRLPKKITTKLTSIVSNFWWGTGGTSSGMHWMSWDKLCRGKGDGGIGFRDFRDANTAFLAKQLWRLIDKPDILFSKVFKGRYFRNTDPLDPVRSYSASYGWRSITSARSLVKKGLIKRVGTGKSISIWNDPWIPSYRPRPATQKADSNHTLITVDQLIDHHNQMWNIQLMETVIVPEDVALILSIPFSRTHRADSLGWFPTKSGKYTVKSGYHLERDSINNGEATPILEPSIKQLQAYSWKVNCPPKIRHFIWQVLSGCAPVAKNLRGRGIKCDTRCARCGADEESINHVMFECPPAIQTWALSPIPTNPEFFPATSIYTNMDYLFWRLPSDKEMDIYPWLMWYIWKSRNDMVYSHFDRNPQETLRLAETESVTWGVAQLKEVNEPIPRTLGGENSEIDLILNGHWCFVDGSWKDGDQFSGQGWYSGYERDANVLMGAMNIRASLSPLHAEFEALVWAMECMKYHKHQHITFATDCSELVKIVSEPEEWPAFSIHLEEFQARREYFTTFQIIHVSRTKNVMADRLARSARLRPSYAIHVGPEPPRWISEK